MKITADTNLLVRAIVNDDKAQAAEARAEMSNASLVAISVPALCELVWVLSRAYRVPSADIATAIRRLAETANVELDRPAVEAGLQLLEAGGDFADGVIAHAGAVLGAETFVSFDREAVRRLQANGLPARMPGVPAG